jgi:hypothetical protein
MYWQAAKGRLENNGEKKKRKGERMQTYCGFIVEQPIASLRNPSHSNGCQK